MKGCPVLFTSVSPGFIRPSPDGSRPSHAHHPKPRQETDMAAPAIPEKMAGAFGLG
jgi:hypothetical protein